MLQATPEVGSRQEGASNRPTELSGAGDNYEEDAGEETEEDDEPQFVVGSRRTRNVPAMEIEATSGDPGTSPFSSHRRARSLNSITLRRSAQVSGKVVVTRTGLMSQGNNQAAANKSCTGFVPDRKSNDASLLVSQFVDDARSSLNDMVDEAKHSLEEWAQTVSRRPDRKYRRSLRWYGSAANISNETMVPATYDDTVAIDDVRCALLDSSRRLNPIDIVLRFDLTLTASILPRVVRSAVALIVFGAYAVTAVMKRFAYLSGRKGDEDDTVVKLSIFVSFIIVFYSNHCYTRFYRQYESVKLCSQLIADAVTMARSLSVLRPSVPCGPTSRDAHTSVPLETTKEYAPPASASRYEDASGALPVVAPAAAPYLEPLLRPNEAAVAHYNTVGGTAGRIEHSQVEAGSYAQHAALSTPSLPLESDGPYILSQQSHSPSLASQRRRANLMRSNEETHRGGPAIVTLNQTCEGRVSVHTLEQLYRYLNVAHVAGYTALSPTYTRENLFEPFVKAHRLLTDAEWRAFRRERLDVEDPSGAAFHEFVLWAVTAVAAARERGEITSPNETVSLQDVIMRFRGAMQSLHDEVCQSFQPPTAPLNLALPRRNSKKSPFPTRTLSHSYVLPTFSF